MEAFDVDRVLHRLADGRVRTVQCSWRAGEEKEELAAKLYQPDEADMFAREVAHMRALKAAACTPKLKHVFELPPLRVMVTQLGMPLPEYVRVLKREGATIAKRVALLQEIGDKLIELHKHGLVHNDFKASQVVLLGIAHTPCLIDLDACRAVGDALPPQTTVVYAPPEVLQAHRDGAAKQTKCMVKHDIWAFGKHTFSECQPNLLRKVQFF